MHEQQANTNQKEDSVEEWRMANTRKRNPCKKATTWCLRE